MNQTKMVWALGDNKVVVSCLASLALEGWRRCLRPRNCFLLHSLSGQFGIVGRQAVRGTVGILVLCG